MSHPNPHQQQQNYNPGIPQDLASLDAEQLVRLADENSREFVSKGKDEDKLTTNQLRNVFAHIVQMRTDYRQLLVEGHGKLSPEALNKLRRRLILLKPKLAYAKGRKPSELQKFVTFTTKAIEAVAASSKPQHAFENFFALMEAVVAYHKYHGGKD